MLRISEPYVTPMRSLLDWLDLKGLGAIFLMLVTVERQLVIACIVLLSVDWLTGMMAAHRRGEEIRSAKMRRIVPKAIEYFLFGVACTVIGNAFPAAGWWVPQWGFGIIAGTEFKSILENVFPAGREHWSRFRERWFPWSSAIDKDRPQGDGDRPPLDEGSE